ncbi:DUF523 domain-containing protein [Caldicellulosiruptoraceae bacterium PP1]
MNYALVSACLLGLQTRYDLKIIQNQSILELMNQYILIPVCPEQLGGLPTPREKSEILKDKVITMTNKDVTTYFIRGANETLKVAKLYNASVAFLKSKSPSCGYGMIYDGTFTNRLINGHGITARLLFENGIKIISVD